MSTHNTCFDGQIRKISRPSCSKHCKLNKLVNEKLVNCCSDGIYKYIDIFAAKM